MKSHSVSFASVLPTPAPFLIALQTSGLETLMDRMHVYGVMARRDYEIFRARGWEETPSFEDWAMAESQILAHYRRTEPKASPAGKLTSASPGREALVGTAAKLVA